jgi:outer membrane lipoprotein carrier protein
MPTLGRLIVMSLLLAGFASQAWAGEGIDRLNEFQRDVQSLRADFDQEVKDANAELMQQSSGTAYLERPNKFRWDYSMPSPQLIVADGHKVWIYDKDLEQVTVKELGTAVGNAPALVLTGQRPLDKDFNLVEQGRRAGLLWVELTPKQKEADFQSVRIGFAKTLEVMELVDNFGQTTRIRFHHLQRNPTLDPKLFEFTPPAGVDVVGQ